MGMETNTDRHHNAMVLLRHVASTLRQRAAAAHSLGMNELGDRLHEMAIDVDQATKDAHESFNAEFYAHIDSIEQGSANMINAVVALSEKTVEFCGCEENGAPVLQKRCYFHKHAAIRQPQPIDGWTNKAGNWNNTDPTKR